MRNATEVTLSPTRQPAIYINWSSATVQEPTTTWSPTCVL